MEINVGVSALALILGRPTSNSVEICKKGKKICKIKFEKYLHFNRHHDVTKWDRVYGGMGEQSEIKVHNSAHRLTFSLYLLLKRKEEMRSRRVEIDEK